MEHLSELLFKNLWNRCILILTSSWTLRLWECEEWIFNKLIWEFWCTMKFENCFYRDLEDLSSEISSPHQNRWQEKGGEEALSFYRRGLGSFTNSIDPLFYLLKKKKKNIEGFPGGPVVKNSHCYAGDTGSIPGRGRPHAPQSSNAHRPQLLSPRALKPVLGNKASRFHEKPACSNKDQHSEIKNI